MVISSFFSQGSVLYNYIKNGKLERTPGDSITEGIGQGRVTQNLKDAPIDDALAIKDVDAVEWVSTLFKDSTVYILTEYLLICSGLSIIHDFIEKKMFYSYATSRVIKLISIKIYCISKAFSFI